MFSPKEIINDTELVVRMKESDPRAFSLFTSKYEKYVFMRCLNYVKDRNVAEDLMQEIFIKVFMQISKFREEAKFSAWLYTIIHNTCIDHLRKTKINIHKLITEELVDELIDVVDYDEELPEELSIEILETLLDQLTPEGKLIILLKYKEKHPIRDIQETMGLSESAVKMRLKRAKELLNTLYDAKLKEYRNKA